MIVNQLVALSSTNVLTVPPGQTYAVVLITIHNYSSSSETIHIYVIPNGQSIGVRNKLAVRELEAGDTLFLSTERLLLTEGDKINAFAATNGTALNIAVSYQNI